MTHAVTISLLGAVLGLDLTGVTGAESHTHPEFDVVAENNEKIDKLYVLNLVDRLQTEHRARCMGYGSQQTINELQVEYRTETGSPYQVQACDYYLSL